MTYLVQRLERKKTEGPVNLLRFGQVFELEYMGSAEFEFGEFPRFLRRMNAATLEDFALTINGVDVFGVFDTARHSAIEVKKLLHTIADGKQRLKHHANFPNTSDYRTTAAWAAIDSDIFWAIGNLNGSIRNIFANSVAWMDAQKQ